MPMWQRDSERFKVFSRRTAILGGFKAALFATLAGRMYYLQVLEADKYTTLADENRISMRLLAPQRGLIVDRFGVALAMNTENYSVTIVKEQTPKLEATLERLSLLISISNAEHERVIREASRRRSFVPVTVKDYLSWDEVAAIEVNTPDLPGVQIDTGRARTYPQSGHLAHIIGYVSSVSEQDMTGDPLLELPGFRIGKSGVEKVYDQALRGSAGTSHVEVNALGRTIRELNRQEGAPGQPLALTIDAALQRYVNERLQESISAAAVVMDCHNGDVLALSSYPSYDPNEFTTGISHTAWDDLVNNPQAPLRNKVVSGKYPPGSTFKMLVAMAAAEVGISPNFSVNCTGHIDVGNHRFHCWKRWGHGHVDMHEALVQSCDVWYYEIAKQLGIDRIAAMAERFGLGEKTGVDLPSELQGLIPTKDWKLATIGERWQLGETLIASIGQGYVGATPLQLAVMTARIASGKAVTPHLSRLGLHDGSFAPRNPETIAPVQVNPRVLESVRHAMDAVCNHPRGTAYPARIERAGMEMAGKSGTSQVRRISKKERATGVRKNEEKPWEERDHALFVAYAPLHAPRYAVSVVVEHGGSGSKIAAPIARDILQKAQELRSARSPINDPPSADGTRNGREA